MGCFSFMCKGCGKPINSDSFTGQRCVLTLIKDGLAIDSMIGEYDSYGRVFDENQKSILWNIPWPDVCDLMFKKEKDNGIVAYHEDCFNPNGEMIRSDDDPDQGWGKF